MFSKNKRKIDSKIRWQNPKFKNRLQEARGYKRPTRSMPEGDWEVFLNKIGLGSRLSKSVTLAVFFFLIYIVYIPNLFFVKHITIVGADQTEQASITTTINSFLDKKTPFPEKNLVFLSKSKLSAYLRQNNQKVLKINKITKDFPSTLVVDVTPRTDEFVIQTSIANYSLSNDGLITSVIEPDASGSLPSSLVLIKLDSGSNLTPGQPALSQASAGFLLALQKQLPDAVKSPIDHYELSNLTTPDLSVYLKNGLKMIFDLNSDLAKTISRTKLLFSQFSDADIKKLYYVDMRFEDRGYVCNKGTPCVKDITLPQATTTPSAITN